MIPPRPSQDPSGGAALPGGVRIDRRRIAAAIARAAWPALLLLLAAAGALGWAADRRSALAAAACLLLSPQSPWTALRLFPATPVSRSLAGLEGVAAALLAAGALPGLPAVGPVGVLLAVLAVTLARGPRAAVPVAAVAAVVVLAGATAGAWRPWDAGIVAAGIAGTLALPALAARGGWLAAAATRNRAAPEGGRTGRSSLLPSAPAPIPEPVRSAFSAEETDLEREALGHRLQALLVRACEGLVAGTGADRCLLYRPVDGGNSFELAASSGARGRARTRVDGREGLFAAVRKTRQPVLAAEGSLPAAASVHAGDGESPGCALAAPLLDGDQLWGIVVLDARDPGALSESGRRLVRELCPLVLALVAQAVELAELRERERLSRAFAAAVHALSRPVRTDEVASAVLSSLAPLAPADLQAVVLVEREGAGLRVVAADGLGMPAEGAVFPATPHEGLVVQALHHGGAIVREDLPDDDRPPLLFGTGIGPTLGLGSVLVVPFGGLGGGPSFGAYVHARAAGVPSLGEEERQRVEVLVRQAGVALSHARLFQELEDRAVTDGMTGLPNHRRFQEELQAMMARASRLGHPVSLLLVDVDHFKRVNDTHGHPAGDEVLRRLAAVLRRSVREGTDLAARYGGEEFAVVLESTDGPGARVLAERLRAGFAAERFVLPGDHGPVTFRCSVSVGIATAPEDGATPRELIARADAALYAAKASGRDRVVGARDARG